jgi:two-component system, chemotaxis family, protein-glutamate methylesterase/glutaminase
LKKTRVLVVDDSVVFRSQIRAALESVDWIEVVGVAANGRIALEKMTTTEVDLISLDLEMPELDGIGTLKEIRRLGLKCKTIVFSSVSKRGAQITLDALELGAADFVPKPGPELHDTRDTVSSVDLLRNLLLPKIENLFRLKTVVEARPIDKYTFQWKGFMPKAIVIGCSTGGPTALEKIFSKLKGPFRCPVLIVQHMPPIFTASLASRIEKICGVAAAEGKNGEVLENKIYMAPGNYHMQVVKQLGELRIQLNQQEQENSVRPAVDQLFRTASAVFQGSCLGIVLTGMGKDGLLGCQQLRSQGNPIIIQNKESCVVFGMPGAVYEASAFDSIQDLDQIAMTLDGFLRAPGIENRNAV